VTVGSLFSGIGGFDLGLERAGMTVKWQVERDPWCQKILAKHWPDVPRYANVEDVGTNLECVDLVCGGFPCQPVSVAGQRQGTDDDRWLWPEFRRIVGLLGPRYVLVENVPGLFTANDGHAFGEVGMTRNGRCYPLPTLAHRTSASASGLLPTPTAINYGTNQGGSAGRVGKVRPSLQTMARQGRWPMTTDTGQLNPTWVEWLMGFPDGWTDCGD